MTPDEALQFGNALPESTIFDRCDARGELLAALETVVPASTLKRARRILLDRAEHFRYGDTPGHEVWYPAHLLAAQMACLRWGRKLDLG